MDCLGDERRKTGWMRAEAAGDPGPWRQQAILGRGRWDADALRDIVRDYVVEHLADDDAVLVVDETGFLKQGKASCGVARQYTGSGGQDHQLPDRRVRRLCLAARPCLHRPGSVSAEEPGPTIRRGWRRRMCRRNGLRDQAALAVAMIERAIAAGVPFAWVAADSVYGVGDVEMALRRAGKGYVLGVNSSHSVQLLERKPADRRHGGRDRAAPRSLATGNACRRATEPRARGCTTGPICELADLDAAEYNDARIRSVDARPADPPQHRRSATWPSSPPGARPEPASRCWSTSKDIAGRSRTASRRPKTSWASTTTRPAPGTAGIATSRSSCWPSP